MKRMTRTTRSVPSTTRQLALPGVPSPAAQPRRPRLPPAVTVRYCNELLATLDRLAALRDAQGDDLRVEQLAKLYEAAVESAPTESRGRSMAG
jgi:hypothetical protein